MKLSVSFSCLFLAVIAAYVPVSAATTPTIYLSARTDGLAGSGTQADPINVSTEARFDAFFAARYAAHWDGNSTDDPVIFQFAAGTYSTTGMTAISGWELIGAGQGSTVINVTGMTYGAATNKYVNPTQGIASPYSSHDIQVKNLTLDGGVLATGIPLSSGFTMPQPRESVNVALPSAANMIVGKWYYVQDTAMTNGIQKWWGLVTCTAINGNTVTLQNAEVATAGTVTGDTTAGSAVVRNVSSTANLENGQTITCSAFGGATSVVTVDTPNSVTLTSKATVTSIRTTLSYGSDYTDSVPGPVLATARLFPAGERAGISLQSHNITIQNVTVQNISVPFYEGWAGISVGNFPVNSTPGTGNLIDSCTVKDMFGIYSAYLSALSQNNQTGNNGTTITATITNNTVEGNGYYQGIGLAGVSDCIISGNKISNVAVGLFSDTGYSTGVTIENNTFNAVTGIHLGVGAPAFFNDSTIKNNTFVLTTPNGTGIGLSLNVSNIAISDNILTINTTADGYYGIVILNLSSGAGGNTATGNQIVSSLVNAGINSSQNEILSYNQINENMDAQSQSVASNTTSSSTSTTASSNTSTTSSTTTSSSTTSSSTTTSNTTTASNTPSPSSTPATSSTNSSTTLANNLNQSVSKMQSISTGTTTTPATTTTATTTGSAETSATQEKQLVLELNALVQQFNSGK